MAIGLPNIDIIFKNLGTSAIARSNNSTVALLLRDTFTVSKPIEITSVLEIPSGLSADNKEQIELAFLGGVNTPKKIIFYTIASDAEIANGLAQFETVKFNYL
ncbi:MAG: phage tail sheath protein, partial [Sarcina sp.]